MKTILMRLLAASLVAALAACNSVTTSGGAGGPAAKAVDFGYGVAPEQVRISTPLPDPAKFLDPATPDEDIAKMTGDYLVITNRARILKGLALIGGHGISVGPAGSEIVATCDTATGVLLTGTKTNLRGISDLINSGMSLEAADNMCQRAYNLQVVTDAAGNPVLGPDGKPLLNRAALQHLAQGASGQHAGVLLGGQAINALGTFMNGGLGQLLSPCQNDGCRGGNYTFNNSSGALAGSNLDNNQHFDVNAGGKVAPPTGGGNPYTSGPLYQP